MITHDSTISAIADTFSELISSLTVKSGLAVDWFEYTSLRDQESLDTDMLR